MDQLCTVLDALESASAVVDRGVRFLDGESDGPGRRLTWRQLISRARAFGARLIASGVRGGDRVAMVLPDSEEFVVAFLGAVSVGVVPVPLYPPLSLGRIESWARTSLRVFAAARVSMAITAPPIDALLGAVAEGGGTPVHLFRALEALPLDGPSSTKVTAPPDVNPADPLFLQFTSGSTAEPRGVVVTHSSLLANARAILAAGHTDETTGDVFLSWLPLYHDMGLIGFLLTPLLLAAEVVLLPTLAFARHPRVWMDALSRWRGTISFAPNFAFARALARATDEDLDGWDLSSVKVLGCGAEPIHAATLRRFAERFARAGLRPHAVGPCYGMAEATLAITFDDCRRPHLMDRVDAASFHELHVALPSMAPAALEFVGCGRALPGHEVAIIDPDAPLTVEVTPLGDRRVGEIVFRGPSVAAGYFDRPDDSRAAFGCFGGGWLRTGDLGYLVDGELFVCGRRKDVLIVNGRKYAPQKVEWLAERVAGVRKGCVAAFTIPAAATEDAVVVAETAENDPARRDAMAHEIRRQVADELGLSLGAVRFLEPGRIAKTTSGKLQRRRVREEHLEYARTAARD